MTTFDRTMWVNAGYARDYREQADRYIPERHYLFQVMRSFFRHFVKGGSGPAICDLGCGDGILAHQLLLEEPALAVTLVDGSEDMLRAARERLAGFAGASFVRLAFEELLNGENALPRFDFVVSGFAIHHLEQPEKAALFRVLFHQLNPGGRFLNLDTAFPAHPVFIDWYYAVWREWIVASEAQSGAADSCRDVPSEARAKPENKLSALADQLGALRAAGFQEVESHYQNGLFSIYSGRKP